MTVRRGWWEGGYLVYYYIRLPQNVYSRNQTQYNLHSGKQIIIIIVVVVLEMFFFIFVFIFIFYSRSFVLKLGQCLSICSRNFISRATRCCDAMTTFRHICKVLFASETVRKLYIYLRKTAPRHAKQKLERYFFNGKARRNGEKKRGKKKTSTTIY